MLLRERNYVSVDRLGFVGAADADSFRCARGGQLQFSKKQLKQVKSMHKARNTAQL
eukprot:COSAG02_NODE_18728_length_922_cov_1.613609_2_plen_55_part_01